MRKKITMLLASLFACVGVMKAEVTDLPQMSTEGDIKWYTIKNVRRQKFATYAGDNASMTQQTTASAASFFYFTGEIADGVATVKIHNYAAGDKLCAAYNSWTATGIDWYLKAQSTGVSISNNIDGSGNGTSWNDARGEGAVIEYWNASDDGSAWEISLVTDFSSIINITDLKTAAKAELDNLANITVLFGDATQAKADVDAVNAASNSLGDLNAAAEEIQAVVANYKKQADDKNVRFTSYGRNTTDGTDLTAVVGGANQTSLSGDAGIWTLKFNEDGTFKMYNFVSNLYLGATAGNGSRVSTCSTFADAAPYTFNAISENRTNIQNNANTLHADGWGNVVQWNPDNTTSESSIWTVVSCDPIVLTREQYDNAAAAASSLPYAIQQAYGLVTDAAKYTSNAPETDPNENSSYDNLLDNTYSSYFHSSWSYDAGAYHYLQAEVSEEVKDFCFYFKKRNGNNNNRPTEIEVQGSSDGSVFTPITTITDGLPTDAGTIEYFSAPITAESNVKYIRFVVKETNNNGKEAGGHPFFTFSEFYIFPATNDVTALIDSYNAFASLSITEEGIVNAATSLINAESTLALANIKKEVNALLTANAVNHAETPVLGQYTTEAYNALNTAYNAADATQESLEEAIATFEAAKNVPVYFITSKHDGYAAGSAIYYDGAWKWKTANIYDRQMWMTIPGYTEENVPVVETYNAEGTSYQICDFLTGTVMRGKSVQIVKIADWEGAYNLQYNTDATSTDAAQHAAAGGSLVNWIAATTSANQASAWQVEYIGNSYDLKKLTDEYLAKGTALKDAYNNVPAYNIAAGMNSYSEPVAGRLADAKAAALASLSKLDTEDNIAAAKAELEAAAAVVTINMPENGKFYRVRCAGTGMKYLQSTLDETNAEDIRFQVLSSATSVNATFCYIDGALVSYTTGLYINAYRFNEVGVKSDVVFSEASNGKLGAYNITVGGRYIFGAQDNNKIDSGAGTPDNRDGYTWWLEEVTELPVVVSAAGFATLYAPVALTIPAEVTVYTAAVVNGYLALTEVEGAIPANTGVIIEATEGTYNFAVAADVAEIEGNALVGAYAKSEKNADAKVYTLQKPAEKEVGFYLFKGQNGEGATTYINGFRAWVEVANGEAAPAMFSLGRGEGTTSIDNVQLTNDNVVIYDLAGRRVEKMEKGIYIVNGKKVVK